MALTGVVFDGRKPLWGAWDGKWAYEIITKKHNWNCPETGQSGNAIDLFMN